MTEDEREKDERALAGAIVEDLFTNGWGDRAVRLVLELPGKRNGGGYSRDPARDIILRHLKAHRTKP